MPTDKQEKISVPFPDEPGAVKMTAAQWEQFKAKLGEDCAYYWCERAEQYAEEWPARWKRYKDHYRTLSNWHGMKVGDGYEWYLHPTHGGGYYKAWVIERLVQGELRR
jgi:hypothetical protein